jgi:outer membrane murein-binding lipoprotein Lpp
MRIRSQLQQRQLQQRQSRQRQLRQSPHHALLVETTIKLTVNLVLAATAVSTLLHLIPYNQKHQADLQRLQTEVKEANAKVDVLQSDFDRHFDPQQAFNIMQEQNIRFNPQQRQVVWLNPEVKTNQPTDRGKQADSSAAPD